MKLPWTIYTFLILAVSSLAQTAIRFTAIQAVASNRIELIWSFSAKVARTHSTCRVTSATIGLLNLEGPEQKV